MPSALVVDHFVLEVRDPIASSEFYRNILGLRPVRLREYLAGRAPFVSARVTTETIIDFMPPRMWSGKKATNPAHFCVALSGTRAMRALERRLEAAGVEIVHRAERNFGARGLAGSIYFLDPDGVTVEARSYSARGSR